MAPSVIRVSSNESTTLKYTSTKDTHKKVDTNLEPEYRIWFKYLGQSISFIPEDLNKVDILGRHTNDDNKNISTKLTHKICVNARLKDLSTMNPMVEFTIKNILDYDSIVMQRIFCINLSNNTFVDVCKSFHPVTIPKFESTKIVVAVNNFAMGKTFKLIVYCEWQSLSFNNEYSFFIKSRPICSMNMTKLNNYFPKAEVRTLDRCNYRQPKPYEEYADDVEAVKTQLRDYEQMDTNSRLTSSNFYKMFKLMLQIEDENDSKRTLHYDQCERTVTHEFGLRYSMKIDDERLEAAVCEYKRIWITPMAIRQTEVKLNELRQMEQEKKANTNGKKHIISKFVSAKREKNERIYGSIVEVIGDKVYFQLTDGLDYFTKITKVAPNSETYFIRFMNDRSTIALQHQALDHLHEDDITDFFFPNSSDMHNSRWEKPEAISIDRKSIRWQTGDINDEQKLAVLSILEQRSFPHPYVLFGPPGTGKTKTLVEAILQMVRMRSMRKHILVCATSNSACDEIVKRLISNGAGHQVFRIFAKSMEAEMTDIPVEVLAVSNLSKSEHYYPSFAVLSKYKVIVCTLTSSGRLTQGHISPQFFSHIFIDEAGSATESQIMIAVAGLCSSKRKIHANLVLAGDPKQLGPLIKSQQAAKLGYGISMLERLISTNAVYMRNEKTKKFNENYITQLIRNYRSHSSILHISNKLFYDNALRVCAPEENINWFSQSDLLHKSNFPIVFHSVEGKTIRHKNETSPYNEVEIKLIINYLKRLFAFERKIVQDDIGIISPYRRQCEEIVNQCKSYGWHNIQTGSVEKFQGQEKPIIIVSTVRSKMKTIGFLDNEKRLNVLLTRAKCLLIIIGDAKTLAEDKYWKYVIDYCKENNSLIS